MAQSIFRKDDDGIWVPDDKEYIGEFNNNRIKDFIVMSLKKFYTVDRKWNALICDFKPVDGINPERMMNYIGMLLLLMLKKNKWDNLFRVDYCAIGPELFISRKETCPVPKSIFTEVFILKPMSDKETDEVIKSLRKGIRRTRTSTRNSKRIRRTDSSNEE